MSGRTFNQDTYNTAHPKTQVLLKELLTQFGLIPIESSAEIFKVGDIIVRQGSSLKTVEGELRGVTTTSPWVLVGSHYHYRHSTLSIVGRKAEDPNTPVLIQISFTEETDGSQNAIIVWFEDVLKAKPEQFYAATRGWDERRLVAICKTLILHRKSVSERWEVCPSCNLEEDLPSVVKIKNFLGVEVLNPYDPTSS